MKKRLVALWLGILLLCLAGCGHICTGEAELIAKARQEINLADANTVQLVIAGSSQEDDRVLFWFVSGSEYQAHTYTPIEFIDKGEDRYEFVHTYKPMDRGTDIAVLDWNNRYTFLVNNPDCAAICIDGKTVSVEEIPFLYRHTKMLKTYEFLDAAGNVLP